MKVKDRQGREWLLSREDRDLLERFTWHVSHRDHYVVSRDAEQGRLVRFHRLVAERVFGAIDGLVVDHKNRNRRDNHRANLRPCTRGENARNRSHGGQAASRTGLVGVYAEGNAYRASITAGGKRRNLGTHPTPEQAAKARDAAARKLHGSFASLNYSGRSPCPKGLAPVPPRPPKPPPRWSSDHFEATDFKGRTWLFSKEDLDLFHAHTWHVWTHSKGKSYVRAGVAGGKDLRFHREALKRQGYALGCGIQGDHVNGIGTDNRRVNLRPATVTQNNRNSRKRDGCRSQWKSVDYNPAKKRYLASTQYEGAKFSIGTYRLEEAAAIAYDLAVAQLFKEFASPNFPDSTQVRLDALEPRTKRSSEYTGTSFDRDTRTWRAYVNHKGKRHHLGRFATEEKALRARRAKEAELLGSGFDGMEFRRLTIRERVELWLSRRR